MSHNFPLKPCELQPCIAVFRSSSSILGRARGARIGERLRTPREKDKGRDEMETERREGGSGGGEVRGVRTEREEKSGRGVREVRGGKE